MDQDKLKTQALPSVPDKVKSEYRIDLSRLTRFFSIFSFKNLQTGASHGNLTLNLKKVVSWFITLMVPSELKKRSNRWFVKAVAITVVFCFTSLQILPPGWADVVSLEEQVQKQIPEKAPSEVITSTQLEEAPNTSIDFLQNTSPLSPPTSDALPFQDTGNLNDLIIDPQPLPDTIEPSSLSFQDELVKEEPIDRSHLESPSLSTGEIVHVDLPPPPDLIPVGEILTKDEDKNFSGNAVASLTVTETKEDKDKHADQKTRTDYDSERYDFEDAL
ncbi:MAG: hypothetical protein HY351_05735, partial [Candidatus Omnitrophica bacterium]|nr:hypothetical protein [Candidatus Omnitrophota bacterium]